jgi:hypothetical protein
MGATKKFPPFLEGGPGGFASNLYFIHRLWLRPASLGNHPALSEKISKI